MFFCIFNYDDFALCVDVNIFVTPPVFVHPELWQVTVVINRLISMTGCMSFRCPFLCVQVFGSGLKEELDVTNTNIHKTFFFLLSAHIFTRA